LFGLQIAIMPCHAREFLNLNNEVFGLYQGSPQYMIQPEYYQPTVSFGLRWSPSRE
jgi:hypothetical protein